MKSASCVIIDEPSHNGIRPQERMCERRLAIAFVLQRVGFKHDLFVEIHFFTNTIVVTLMELLVCRASIFYAWFRPCPSPPERFLKPPLFAAARSGP